jgi:hypothetical protein
MTCIVRALRVRPYDLTVLTTMALLSLTACGPGAASTSPGEPLKPVQDSPPSATPDPAATLLTDPAGQHALTAYQGMWWDFAAAGTTSDWRSPSLARYATGIALSNMSRGLYADHYNGLVTKGTASHDPRVSSTSPPGDPNTVTVSDCSDSTHYLKYRASSGKLANDGPGGRQLINATVRRQADGSWKVSDFGVQGVGTC